jgi:hypothetical protein
MSLAFEDFAPIDADAFEDAVAVEQAVVVDADLGVFLVVEFAVDPDFEGHGGSIAGNWNCGIAKRRHGKQDIELRISGLGTTRHGRNQGKRVNRQDRRERQDKCGEKRLRWPGYGCGLTFRGLVTKPCLALAPEVLLLPLPGALRARIVDQSNSGAVEGGRNTLPRGCQDAKLRVHIGTWHFGILRSKNTVRAVIVGHGTGRVLGVHFRKFPVNSGFFRF